MRFLSVENLRDFVDDQVRRFDIPKLNPNMVSGGSLVLSLFVPLGFLFYDFLGIFILFLVLCFDYLDGFIAREYGLDSEEGYMVDVVVDRVSEGVIFMVSVFPWFVLFSVNNLLALRSFRKDEHFILPLRHFYLIYMLFLSFKDLLGLHVPFIF